MARAYIRFDSVSPARHGRANTIARWLAPARRATSVD